MATAFTDADLRLNASGAQLFRHNGKRYAMEIVPDQTLGPPWQEHDGHGVVSDWVSRPKRPGERVLIADGARHRLYDIEATLDIALRDGWGEIKPGQSPRQRAAAAVEQDFQRMRAWCNDEWGWVGVVVHPLHDDGCICEKRQQSLWGIESDCGDQYLNEVAQQLAEELQPTKPQQ